MTRDLASLMSALRDLRDHIEKHFHPDTAAQGFPPTTPSSGHCAAVATIIHQQFGGTLASAVVDGVSHWFNRFDTNIGQIDVDITGDQFGLPAIRHAKAGKLFPETRARSPEDLIAETFRRAQLLAERAGLPPMVPGETFASAWKQRPRE